MWNNWNFCAYHYSNAARFNVRVRKRDYTLYVANVNGYCEATIWKETECGTLFARLPSF